MDELRKVPRIRLSREQFRHKKNGKIFGITDLSEAGVRLRLLQQDDLVLFALGSVIQGELSAFQEKLPVSGRVVRIGPKMVALEFCDLPEETKSVLQRELKPEKLSKTLWMIPTSGAGEHWFHGHAGTEIYCSEKKGTISVFLGTEVLSYDEENGIRTGIKLEEEETFAPEESGLLRLESVGINWADQYSKELLKKVVTLVEESNLKPELKIWMKKGLSHES